MTESLLLGIDLGTSAVKVLLVDHNGVARASSSAAYPIMHPAPDHAEQDPATWWAATVTAVRQALRDAGDAQVTAIGLSGQMHGVVMLDAADRLVRPAIIWPDQRSAAQVREITDLVGAERLIRLTGSPVAAGFLAASVRWCQAQEPEIWARVRRLLLPKDYLRRQLTGDFATDPSDGSGALLLDVNRRDWSDELLAMLAIDRTQLPAVHAATASGGVLHRRAAAELGLPAGIPVAVGAADTACSALAAGATQAGMLLLTLSTGGQLLQPVDAPTVDVDGRVHTFCSALDPTPTQAGWYQMGAILAAGLALRWLRDQVLGWNDAAAYGRMTDLAAAVPPGARDLLFLPYLTGVRTPHMNPAARGQFTGLTLQHGQGELIRAVMEGVVFACYDGYRVLAQLAAPPESIILAGGGARSALWQQIVADVFGLPVRPLDVAEQSALGATLLAGHHAGLFDAAAAARAWARYGPEVAPDPTRGTFYQSRYALFQAAYQATASMPPQSPFNRLNHL